MPAQRVCSRPGCPELTPNPGRCDTCKAAAEVQRGTPAERGYGHEHSTQFRDAVLRRNPMCVCLDANHGHGTPCLAPSTVADHHPMSRRDLVAAGRDPNDPAYGRGLCETCHGKHTAAAQPGGWNARD